MKDISQVYVVIGLNKTRAWVVGAYKDEKEAVGLRRSLQALSDAFYYQTSDVEFGRIRKDTPGATTRLHAALGHKDPEAVFSPDGTSYVVESADLFL